MCDTLMDRNIANKNTIKLILIVHLSAARIYSLHWKWRRKNLFREELTSLFRIVQKFFLFFGVFCAGSILPVHPDAVKDDSEADVEDEVDFANNQGNNCRPISSISSHCAPEAERDHVEDEESTAESQEYSKEFIVLNSYSMNFHAGKNEKNCGTNDVDDVFPKNIAIAIVDTKKQFKNRDYDQSNWYNDLQGTRDVSVNFPYFFNARDILLP